VTAETTRVPRVIKPEQLDKKTDQTYQLDRFVAVNPEKMDMQGPSRIFFGRGYTPPNSITAPHHHAEAETAGYVLSGTIRIYFGEGFKDYITCTAGDFMYVPPFCPHIEVTFDEEFIGLFARSPENIVHNLPIDPDWVPVD
jgi:uncharacterized RmlC-like cupin family protein